MKKLLCKIGLVLCLTALCLFFFMMAYDSMSIPVALFGIVLSLLGTRICWVSFVRLELASRHHHRRIVRVPRPLPVRTIHAA